MTDNNRLLLSPEALELLSNNFRNTSDYIMDQFIRESSRKYNMVLEEYIRKNLLKFGYDFKTNEDFIKFVSERITKIGFSENPNDYQYFLDYRSESDKGILIGISNEEIHFEYEKNKITVTIGTRLF